MWKVVVGMAGGSLVVALIADQHRKAAKRLRIQSQMDEVLDFWFVQHSTDWFLVEGAGRSAFDLLVTTKFQSLLDECLRGELSDWPVAQSHRAALAQILLLDQFARHVFRDDREKVELCGAKARELLSTALGLGLHLQCNGEELGFLLMPYRHELPLQQVRMRLVLKLVDEHEQRQIQYKRHLDRFKRASESRASELRQAAPEAIEYTEADILDRVCEESHTLERKRSSVLISTLERYCHTYPGRTLFVSLSGGVDSMVITDCLLYVKRSDQRVVCAHVDYGNRPESHAESAFLQRFCKRNGIELFVSDLAKTTGLLRGVTDREEYEEKSRNIRFDLYKQVWHQALGETGMPPVVFGHHQGDVVENVLSNAMKGKTLVELSGMTKISTINDCEVNRPLLGLTKQHIYDYAQEFSVPYFKDTTPRWSTRGQVRNELLPSIERVYGKGFPLHLARLAEQSDETYALLVGNTDDLLEDLMVGGGGELVAFALDLHKLAGKPMFVWRIALRKACHHAKVLTATDKAVKFLFDSFHKTKRAAGSSGQGGGWFVEMRKGIRAYVWDNQYLVLFKIDPERILGSDTSSVQASSLLAMDGPAHVVGCWQVHLVSEGEEGSKVTMDGVWRTFVIKNEGASGPVQLEYSIPSGTDYRVLARSQKKLANVEMDLALRQALLPVVAAGKEHRPNSLVRVICTWIGSPV
ncbi:tRNA(Ile)-lysidine synthetase [Batrachochytrium salamandrivorans]|nr:tRNA(Ile)-lysidine synthetase [Batrachochytrium salamandrivorans]